VSSPCQQAHSPCVWFSYQTGRIDPDWILKNLSFYLPPGRLGLGRTGSKTTLARLLRLYDPKGSVSLGVTVDQTRCKRCGSMWDWSPDVAISNQRAITSPFFDPRSMTTNSYALDVLGLSAWLHSLPGLDTPLGSDSGGLSAGQAQLRLCSYFCKTCLVILDEASSRLDPTTEALIERAVNRLLQGRTGIIIPAWRRCGRSHLDFRKRPDRRIWSPRNLSQQFRFCPVGPDRVDGRISVTEQDGSNQNKTGLRLEILWRLMRYQPKLYVIDSIFWILIMGLPAVPGLIIREFSTPSRANLNSASLLDLHCPAAGQRLGANCCRGSPYQKSAALYHQFIGAPQSLRHSQSS